MKTISIQYNGSVTFWTPKECPHSALEASMAAEGLQEFVPCVRTDSSALKLALDKYATGQCPVGSDYEVSPLDKPGTNGYEMVIVQRGQTRNARQHVVSCTVDGGFVRITDGYGSMSLLQNYYNIYKSLVTSDAVGRAFVRVATEKLHGLNLRPNGGLYWIPDMHVADWMRYAQCIEQPSGSVVTTGAWEANASTISRVRESLLSDVQDECTKILEDLSDGKQHDELFLDRRAQAMRRVLERVETVEAALQENLDDCRRRLEFVQSVFASATMAAI